MIGPAVALLEFVGGLALITGFLTRPVALGLALNMLGALFFVHLPAGFFMPNGIEFVLALFGSVALLTLVGAGDCRWIVCWRAGPARRWSSRRRRVPCATRDALPDRTLSRHSAVQAAPHCRSRCFAAVASF